MHLSYVHATILDILVRMEIFSVDCAKMFTSIVNYKLHFCRSVLHANLYLRAKFKVERNYCIIFFLYSQAQPDQ